jgi:hypothetical protein
MGIAIASLDEVSCTAGSLVLNAVPPAKYDADGILAVTGTPITAPTSSGCEDYDHYTIVPSQIVICAVEFFGVAVLMSETQHDGN